MVTTRVAQILNTSPFTNCLELTPFKIFHPSKIGGHPAVGQTLENVREVFHNPSLNLKRQIELTNYLHGLRRKMIEARKYHALPEHHSKIHDAMQPGSLVLLKL